MLPNRYKIGNGIHFNSIKTDKFKSGRISITMLLPLDKSKMTARVLLSQVITRSCEKYPDFISFNRRLNELYGASLSSFTRKIGESLGITISIAGLDDRFLMNGDKISEGLTSLLCDILFAPKLEGEAFSKEDTEQERRELIDAINAEINDKRAYAINKCMAAMCKDELYGVSRYGTLVEAQTVTAHDIYNEWINALKTAQIEIISIGMFDDNAVMGVFEKLFSSVERDVCTLSTQIIRKADKVKEIIENDEVIQAKLIMGFRSGIAVPDEETAAMRLAIALLGGVQSSKLFINVREKQSLCYYCSASYMRNKGIVLIDSGVEDENVENAKTEILRQIELMKNGDITDEELTFAKLALNNSFRSTADTVGGTELWFISQITDGKMQTVDQACDEINSITKEQVIKAISYMTLDTVFALRKAKEL